MDTVARLSGITDQTTIDNLDDTQIKDLWLGLWRTLIDQKHLEPPHCGPFNPPQPTTPPRRDSPQRSPQPQQASGSTTVVDAASEDTATLFNNLPSAQPPRQGAAPFQQESHFRQQQRHLSDR